jgi:hypothetical protein
MKKSRLYLLGLLTVVMFSSCNSNDDTTSNEVQPTIINKWSLDSWKMNNTQQALTTCDKQGYIKFNSNGTFERMDYFFDGTNCIIEGNDNGTYNYNTTTNKITLSFTDVIDGPQVEVLNNVNLSSTKLIYTWDEDGNGSDEHQLEYLKN